jgi:hypothetical protein
MYSLVEYVFPSLSTVKYDNNEILNYKPDGITNNDQAKSDRVISDQVDSDQAVIRVESCETFSEEFSEVEHSIILERNREMKKIANDVEHIHDITLMLSQIVDEQGEYIEIAQHNVENSEINVREAKECLEKAEVHDIKSKIKGFLLGGTVVSGCVTGAGGIVLILNPIAGGIVGGIGVCGLALCVVGLIKNI